MYSVLDYISFLISGRKKCIIVAKFSFSVVKKVQKQSVWFVVYNKNLTKDR